MLEYAAVLSKNQGGWLEEALYQIQTLGSSPFFWPGVVIAVVSILVAARWFLR